MDLRINFVGLIISNMFHEWNLRFESSVNLEGSKTNYSGQIKVISFESSVNLESKKVFVMYIL